MPKMTLERRKYFNWQVRVTEQTRDLVEQLLLKEAKNAGRFLSKTECFDRLISKLRQQEGQTV